MARLAGDREAGSGHRFPSVRTLSTQHRQAGLATAELFVKDETGTRGGGVHRIVDLLADAPPSIEHEASNKKQG